MIWRKKYLLLAMFGLTLLLGLALIKMGDFNFVIAQETLSCTVRTSSCQGNEVVVFRMQNTTNSHAGTPTGSTYPYLVCCGGVEGLGNSCSGNYAVVLKLSGATNAHVEQYSQTNYAHNVCMSTPAGKTISIGYQSGNCSGFDTIVASLSGSGITNCHVGDANAYPMKVCAKVTTITISVSVEDGIVTYGILPPNTSKSTLPDELNDMQTATNDGDVTANFNIKGQDSASWELADTNGTDQYVHMFCNNTDNDCSSPPTNYIALDEDSYTALDTNIPVNGTVNFHLRLTTPNPSTVFTQQSVNVMIQAVQAP